MVDVKKVGVIATSVPFIGATFGMASAVTVPTIFETSTLAYGDVVKAQLGG